MSKETEFQSIDRTYRTLAGRVDTPEPPAGAESVAIVKCTPRRGRRSDPGIILVSREERMLVTRFVRLIRTNYWLSHFVKNLLRLDAASPEMVTIAKAKEQLSNQEDIEALVGKLQYIGRDGWWRDHPAINAVAEEWDDVYEYKGDRAICKLIESAKQQGAKR